MQEDVVKELKKYKKLELVTRDGAPLYKNAIKLAGEHIIQVNDKFHLIKNIIDAIKDDLKKLVPHIINLDENVYDLSWIKLELSKNEKSIQERIVKKQELINRIRNDKNNKKYTMKDLISKYKLEFKTIKRYLTTDATPQRRSNINITELNEYSSIIYEMLCKQKETGINFYQIYCNIKNKGYSSSYQNFYKQLSLRIRENSLHSVSTITKKHISSLLYGKTVNDLDLCEDIKMKLKDYLKKDNPHKQAIETIDKFRKILQSKSTMKIETFITRCRNKKFVKWTKLSSFVDGLERDIDASKNQIKYKETNSTTEGFVSKIKTIKKRTYGRASFAYLRSLILLR